MRAAISLGSNLGDRRAHIERALAALENMPGVSVEAVSSLIETEPVGDPPQGPYLNGAALVSCELDPHGLLAVLQDLERAAGRESGSRWGPRPLDLDVLLLDGGQRVVRDDALEVPHPRLTERRFVLEPLAEIAPQWKTAAGGRTVGERCENRRVRL